MASTAPTYISIYSMNIQMIILYITRIDHGAYGAYIHIFLLNEYTNTPHKRSRFFQNTFYILYIPMGCPSIPEGWGIPKSVVKTTNTNHHHQFSSIIIII